MTAVDLETLVATVTQLPEEQAQEVLDFAQYLLSQSLPQSEQEPQLASWVHDSLWGLVGLGESGVTDSSVAHDKYLYGEGRSGKTATYRSLRERDEE